MNRRELIGGIAALATLALAPVAMVMKPQFEPPPSTGDWETDHAAMAQAFVEHHNASGGPSLYLFKTRSGQFVFSVYGPHSGNPTSTSAIYLMRGLPKVPIALPRHGEMKDYDGARIVGITLDHNMSRSQFHAHLRSARRKLEQ